MNPISNIERPMLIQLVSIEVKPGTRATFLDAFRINCEGTRQEPGNLRFDLLADPENENRFFVYEVFQDAAALEAHRLTDHYRRCVEMIDPISLGTRGKQYFDPIDMEDLRRG